MDHEAPLREQYNTENSDRSSESKPFIILYDVQNQCISDIRLLNIGDDSITAVSFGPFDNGHLLIGLSSGILLAIDIFTMEVMMNLKLFRCSVKDITFEPTNLLLVASTDKDLVALSIVKREMHYVYLELGKKQFGTVSYPHQRMLSDPSEAEVGACLNQ